MRRAAIGDVHLSGFQSDMLDDSGLPLRLSLIIKTLDFIAQECRKRNITHADIVGDLINDKAIIFTIAQDVFKEFLKRNPDIEFVIISGNHDMSSTGDIQRSAIGVFSEYSNVKTVMYEPAIQGNITYVPYTKDFLTVLKGLQSSAQPTDILISHLGLNEAMLQSGLSRIDKVTLRDICGYKLSILGHYHKPQELTYGESRVYYPGSIIHKDWNDKNESKRFLIYDTETLEVESIPITGFRQYKEYIIDGSVPAQEILAKAEEDKKNGHTVRVRNKTKEKIKEESSEIQILQEEDIDITNRGIAVTQTTEEQLKKYLEIKNIPESERQEYLDILHKFNILHNSGES
jgi:DNA repair exonuclease SbcCD nuclease subunit